MYKVNKTYICIDLKSFYASVECVELGLDPMTTDLVVADPERSGNTICLAITPAMKAKGIRNRCRVFEIPKGVKYIMAPPRMQLYIDYAANIYAIYLEYISKDDIHVYSIDEVFIDATTYLDLYNISAKDFANKLMGEVYDRLGVRATAGIGTNMYLAKIALDITAKHSPDFIGVLDEKSYIETLWDHLPLTDFWRMGPGTVNRLAKYGIYTMRDIAKTDEDFLYRIFGIDAELMIDHAYGIEPTTIAEIKKYVPRTNSLCSGQVLMSDYEFEDGCLIVKEMMDLLCLDLVDRKVVAHSISLIIGYSNSYALEAAKGTVKLPHPTSADVTIMPLIEKLYREIVDPQFPIRRVNIICNNLVPEDEAVEEYTQMSLFDDDEEKQKLTLEEEKNKKIQEAVLSIKNKYGKDAVLKAMNLEEKAMTIKRNHQIGGHKSGV